MFLYFLLVLMEEKLRDSGYIIKRKKMGTGILRHRNVYRKFVTIYFCFTVVTFVSQYEIYIYICLYLYIYICVCISILGGGALG